MPFRSFYKGVLGIQMKQKTAAQAFYTSLTAITGLVCTLLCLVVFGSENFLNIIRNAYIHDSDTIRVLIF